MPKPTCEDGLSPRKIEALQKLAAKNFGRFAITVQHMSAEAQIKLIQQLPEFRKLATEAVSSMEKSYKAALDSIDGDAKPVHDHYGALVSALSKRLDQPDLTREDERWFLQMMAEAVSAEVRMVAENRNAKVAMFGKAILGTAVVAVAVVVAVAGGTAGFNQGDSDSA
ncbi:hypothetical protein C5E06_02735 [Pseudoclavibacter sp. RFBI5]|uniref:hypothetical protein n=1 Tax=Pseudoclavibacter sp. RFBI5 TaxID=2080578 RepID=UPI000CE86700|nr:hypothetical protein [Pseudoclavibacter sp. RFBI5]PPG05279.1 hypothetical protein C5E06_02735 [Pseudoclavibacter sp. RFBI5]